MIKSLGASADEFIFIDETHKGAKEMERTRAWGNSHKQPRSYLEFGDERFSMIAAMNVDGFVLDANRIVVTSRGETIDTAQFLEYVEFLLLPVLGKFVLHERNCIVVLDNGM